GIGVGVVGAAVLRNEEGRRLRRLVGGVELDQLAVPLQRPEIAVGIEAEHGPPGRPGRELTGRRIIFDGAIVHADDDVALVVQLQLVRAAAGIARTAVGVAAVAAAGTLRQRERHFGGLAGLAVDPPEHIGEVVGVVGVAVVHN